MVNITPIKVLIADDHPAIREGLSSMLGKVRDFKVVGEAQNGQEAVDLARELNPDVILMDLRMPEMDGFEAMACIRRGNPSAKVIVLTTYESDEDVFRAVEAGAKGYLLKDIGRQGLFDAIRAVHDGVSLMESGEATETLARFAKLPRDASSIQVLSHTGLEVKTIGDIISVGLKGRIDASIALDIEKQLLSLVSEGARRLVADLSEVDFISSAGLKSLLAALKEARGAMGDLRLAGVRERVGEVLDVTGFSTLFRIYPDAVDAVRSFYV